MFQPAYLSHMLLQFFFFFNEENNEKGNAEGPKDIYTKR